MAGGNPTIYGYVCDPNWWLDPFGLKINFEKFTDEARSRGMSDVVNNKYPNINKVSELQPPKSTDAKVPKICQ